MLGLLLILKETMSKVIYFLAADWQKEVFGPKCL